MCYISRKMIQITWGWERSKDMNRWYMDRTNILSRLITPTSNVRAIISIATGSSWSPCKMTTGNKMASVLAIFQTPGIFGVYFPGFFCTTLMCNSFCAVHWHPWHAFGILAFAATPSFGIIGILGMPLKSLAFTATPIFGIIGMPLASWPLHVHQVTIKALQFAGGTVNALDVCRAFGILA